MSYVYISTSVCLSVPHACVVCVCLYVILKSSDSSNCVVSVSTFQASSVNHGN